MTEDVAKDKSFEEIEKKQIQKHEGYREEVYLDTVGVPTGGWGHAFHVGSTLPKHIWENVFTYDFNRFKVERERLIEEYNLHDLDHVRRLVLIDMLFNLGPKGVRGFKNTLKYIQEGNYEQAASNMLKSKWASQVKSRADILARQMKTGRL